MDYQFGVSVNWFGHVEGSLDPMSLIAPIQFNQTDLSRFSNVTVVGLGVTGYSVVRYFSSQGRSVNVVDTRSEPSMAANLRADYPQVKSYYGDLNCEAVLGADLLVVSPGVSLRAPALLAAKYNGAVIIGDVEIFLKVNQAPLIAITGSNGKSTVTSLVGEICRAAGMTPLVAGNIGKPVLDAITDQENYNLAVLELSSFQLETTRSVPAESAAILNISEDHMDRYDSMGDYVLAKAKILRGANRAILPRHDERLEQITNANDVLSFGLDQPLNGSEYGVVREKSGRWLMQGRERIMKLRDVPLTGMHNVLNVLSALALTDFLKLPQGRVIEAIKSFGGLPHRMQTVIKASGITWVNDSKATNVGATKTALQSLEGNLIWIAGGEGKGADFDELKEAVGPSMKMAILFGSDAKAIADSIAELAPISHVATMKEACELAYKKARDGDVVLLSPACASFDMFRDFEHRGQSFVDAVLSLVNGKAEVEV
ncbi:UDP-N-acetylmuramoyl-L-alanine--D-glutamate ligase [Arenicella sp. 4NH20-0111]